MVSLRGTCRLFKEESECVTELKEFLLSAMEVILIYSDIEEQLLKLGPTERAMVYNESLSDQLVYWQQMG